MAASTDVYWDPFDVEIDTEPYEAWRRLRDDAPVYFNDRYGFYALSRYDDVEYAHRQPAVFSSAHGVVIEMMTPRPMTDTGMMIMQDPPNHEALRALVSRAFTPKRVADLERFIRETCARLLDARSGSGGFDFLQDYGNFLPSMVISQLLGVPDADREAVRRVIDTVFHIEPGVGMINDVSFAAQIELHGYLTEQLQQRRERPRDDLLTGLVQAEISTPDGTRRLTMKEAADMGNLLVSAGTETVGKLLGWTAVVLAAHPDQRAELAADATLIPRAIEELLRFEPPSPVQGRWSLIDFERHGVTIPKDSKVVLLTGAACRDERKYPEPDRFDIHRELSNHVAFGFGIHFCLGAALARMEGRVALEEMLRRYPEWEVDHARARRVHTSTVRGYQSVPVTV